MNQQDMMEAQVTEAENKETIAKGDAVERLLNNRDFQEIFLKGYFTDKVLSLSSTLARSETFSSANSKGISEATVKEIAAIGMCRQYIDKLLIDGEQASLAKVDFEAEMNIDLQEQISQGQFDSFGV